MSHMISSAARGVLQTFVAMAVFGDSLSLSKALGIFLILMGSCLYTYFKNAEVEEKRIKENCLV